ncbi:MAG: OmpA family protein [Tabrizicola sp.]|uniref:OmpA family protein n=1 Tax=Tabrizicola sp. TaxID=2005166 RepID=UPI002ABA104D|nr:OmpA family protein [Tabrizicola sp.]MDZ4088258.1 OmpA family protein [Tabrizicola sp.]
MKLLLLRLAKLSSTTLALLAYLLAAGVMISVAYGAALVIESRTQKVVTTRLAEAGIDWITVDTDGLQVRLTGTAPREADRFRAVNMVGALIDTSRIRDGLDVTPASAIEAPKFSVEMLRTEDEVQLSGLIPENPGEGGLTETTLSEAAAALAQGTELPDMLETADYPAPATWNESLAFGLAALEQLKLSKISVAADRVGVKAIADSEAEKRRLETELRGLAPANVQLVLDISAPRPVITPFTLRFVKDAEGARFDSCSADTDRARAQILRTAATAGVEGASVCQVGLGVPTPRWAEAVGLGIAAVTELGSGSITFSDADVTLLAGSDVPQDAFDKVVGELETGLPDVFSLTSTLEKKETATQGPAEFTATLSEAGRVELRGRLTDEMQRQAVDAFAKSAFSGAQVLTATRLDETLPDGWPVRVLAGLKALAEVEHGKLLVRADLVEVTGVTGSTATRGRITQILSDELGQGQTFRVNVRYDEALDPLAALPTPEECAADVNAVIARTKITFTPASAEIATTARPVLDELAAILTNCPAMQMEIGGHTDSQGSEGGNQALSQARAEAVLLALQGRRVDVSGMTALGYGETKPIAENETEAGREANRRIEFVLQGVPQAAAVATDGAAQPAAATAAPAETPTVAAEGADFSGDTSPSVAPTEKTIAPKPRPQGLQAEAEE